MTEQIDYDALAEALTKTWRNMENRDKDPVTEGQMRNAKLIGQMGAGFARELEYCQNNGIPTEIFLAIMAAIFAGETLNCVRGTNDARAAALVLVKHYTGYLKDMLEMQEAEVFEREDGTPRNERAVGPNGMVYSGSIKIPKKEKIDG